jgi:hypothetical protein
MEELIQKIMHPKNNASKKIEKYINLELDVEDIY